MPAQLGPYFPRRWMHTSLDTNCSLLWLQQLARLWVDPPANFSIAGCLCPPRKDECTEGIAACLPLLTLPPSVGPLMALPEQNALWSVCMLVCEKHSSSAQRDVRALLCYHTGLQTSTPCCSSHGARRKLHRVCPGAATTLLGSPGEALGLIGSLTAL